MSNQLELCVSSVVVEGVRVSVSRYVEEVVIALSREYNFSASEASSKLGLVGVKVNVTGGSVVRNRKVVEKECVEKSAFPLPFIGRNVEECCQSLRQSQGLYTQCRNSRVTEKFCKSCSSKMVAGVPEYGTIEQRLAVGVNDYVDPSGRKVVHYTKIMKKYKVSEEQVIAEAKKFGQVVDGCHFIQPESDNVKRGRPKAEKPAKVSSGVKGRPKKTKKVVEIDGEEDDLFASLVAESINASVAVEVETVNAVAVSEVESITVGSEAVSEAVSEVSKAPEVATKEKVNKSEEKAAKLATKEQEKAAKLAAKEQEKAAKEQEKVAKEQEKAAKLAAKEQEKAAKEQEKAAKLAAKSEAKSAKPTEKPAAAKAPANDETSAADVVKKIEFEGKKYLKSKKTGIVYDYDEYVKSGDQVVVGKWNDATNKLDFESARSEEESEDEYDEEE
jgi:flagellar biosynthesis GTPase FlhF